jgi:hypothetical protein
MKSFVPMVLLAGLLLAGCASDNSDNFSSVPPPSGQPTVATTTSAPQSPATTPAQQPQPKPEQQPQPKPVQPIVAPDISLAGKVVKYNSVGRFVVLSFPPGQMPKTDQTLFVYRGGLKTGELKISGEKRDNYIVADIVSGEAQPGDDAREQ